QTLRLAAEGGPAAQDAILMLKSSGPRGPVAHARVEYFQGDASLGVAYTSEKGVVRSKLAAGDYSLQISAIGHGELNHEITVEEGQIRADNLNLERASRIRAKIVDESGLPIPAKVQFIGIEGTKSPDYGPTSAIYAVRNAVYTANGKFEQPIDPGKYRVIVSHGPEYDADFREIEVTAGKLVQLSATLPRVVDTTGWISSEFHSHSTPSGDNVSHQTGRVLNLLAEHLEFAPCTEHNRIDTYSDDLELLGATRWMATCTGMELTGGPLPINHQNAFPLEMHTHEQDGGGPQVDSNPVKQIERLALWDNSASKVVQANHPDIPAILGDRDVNGQPDDGFRAMLGWMDIIEIHPPQFIFDVPKKDLAPKDRRNRMFYWLQLLNLGYRIPGVVNTDAHYNFHGSGWLRNYMESPTDLPYEIKVSDMIHSAEHGHMVMTSGPFLEAEIRKAVGTKLARYNVGEDIDYSPGDILWIRVQCPNWFDINRVQVFANGRPLPKLNFTRKANPKLFTEDVVRFETQFLVPDFKEDTHLIVATIGEGLTLGPVMGTENGARPPVAVTNPFFLDVDGGGFKGNGDDLGIPFLLDVPEE
ncbi:MAG: CehA/McbA family metallohydrolase, partial [Planctomycetota bacterium]